MRERSTNAGVTVNAIAGTHVVILGLDLAAARCKGCLGFAIQREDHTESDCYWMTSTKTFKETDSLVGPGGKVSSHAHPFKSFQWADYSAKPQHDYTYTVIPLYGMPASLMDGDGVRVRISTEREIGEEHSVFFNRGAVASQEYARRFQNQVPDKIGEAAFRWLSRGLFEAFVKFVSRANGKSYGLYGAVYEFQWPEALKAIKAVSNTGADVRVIYDAIPGNGPVKENKKAISAVHLKKGLCIPHTKGKIMHNKFFVLTKNKKPIAVWTGSTNFTENGIFGHSNCGHIIEDEGVAAAYLDYWRELKRNQESSDEKIWMAKENPAPPDPWKDDMTVVFSPRKGLDVLEWYTKIAGGAKKALFMTFAFGMNKGFQKVYEQKDGVLRFALMDKEGNGRGLEQGKRDIRRIRALPNVIIAIGNYIALNSFDRWLKERRQIAGNVHVPWIHTKYMLVDPLSDKPVVVTGSANFSKASTNTNDENMVVIRNNQRIADIYLGEFFRLYSHYAFRETVARSQAQGTDKKWQPKYLVPNDSWQEEYFKKGHQRFLRRQYFAGL